MSVTRQQLHTVCMRLLCACACYVHVTYILHAGWRVQL
jgi:hypothetical protein